MTTDFWRSLEAGSVSTKHGPGIQGLLRVQYIRVDQVQGCRGKQLYLPWNYMQFFTAEFAEPFHGLKATAGMGGDQGNK